MLGLQSVITSLKASLGVSRVRLLDAPCGDMVWMRRFLDGREDVEYVGVDIVPELIEKHKKQFADKPWKFQHIDIIKVWFRIAMDL